MEKSWREHPELDKLVVTRATGSNTGHYQHGIMLVDTLSLFPAPDLFDDGGGIGVSGEGLWVIVGFGEVLVNALTGMGLCCQTGSKHNPSRGRARCSGIFRWRGADGSELDVDAVLECLKW